MFSQHFLKLLDSPCPPRDFLAFIAWLYFEAQLQHLARLFTTLPSLAACVEPEGEQKWKPTVLLGLFLSMCPSLGMCMASTMTWYTQELLKARIPLHTCFPNLLVPSLSVCPLCAFTVTLTLVTVANTFAFICFLQTPSSFGNIPNQAKQCQALATGPSKSCQTGWNPQPQFFANKIYVAASDISNLYQEHRWPSSQLLLIWERGQ